jgi:hypothetical protein
MDGTEIMELNNDMDALVSALQNDNTEELKKLTGQGEGRGDRVGLPRLGINYDQETDDGNPLTRGDWKIFVDGEFLYSPEVKIQSLMRMFEYSMWDAEANEGRGGFSCKSVQKPKFDGTFPDTEGGNKCGRLTRQEEEQLDQQDPAYLKSRAVICNQVIYGTISGTFKNGAGQEVTLEKKPMIAYFKKSGFKPIADFINGLGRQDKLMAHCEINLRTHKNKKGSVVYWTPVPTLSGVVGLDDDDKQLVVKFDQTIRGHNEAVLREFKEAQKLLLSEDDSDLASDFADAS